MSIGAPPLLAGAFQVSLTLPLAGVATGDCGAVDAIADTTVVTAAGVVVTVAIADGVVVSGGLPLCAGVVVGASARRRGGDLGHPSAPAS